MAGSPPNGRRADAVRMLVVHGHAPEARSLDGRLSDAHPAVLASSVADLTLARARSLTDEVQIVVLPADADPAVLRAFDRPDAPAATIWTERPDEGLERRVQRLGLLGTLPIGDATMLARGLATTIARARERRARYLNARPPQPAAASWSWDRATGRLVVDAPTDLPIEREAVRDVLRMELEAALDRRATTFHHTHELRREDATIQVHVDGSISRGADRDLTVTGSLWCEVPPQKGRRARRDPLTGLPGREMFLEHLGVAYQQFVVSGRAHAVVSIDIDNLRGINDALGHGVGDLLLRWVAQRLKEVADELVVARVGNDEFAVLVPAASSRSAEGIAQDLLSSIAQPLSLDGHLVYPSARAGVATADGGHPAPDSVFRDAHAALSRAKRAQRRRIVRFTPAMREDQLDALKLDRDLRAAVANDTLELHYQPIVDLRSGRALGFEALLRWSHPERGWVPPHVFLKQAEKNGLILPLGRWVLHDACATIRRVRAEHPDLANAFVTVNLSPVELQQPDLIERVVSALRAEELPPEALRLELTENTAMTDPERSLLVLETLRDRGIQILIDDFGTGYSSLNYLARLPADVLKVDRSFVDGLGVDARKTRVVCTIIDLAESLGLRVVAEGIETNDHVAWAQRLGIQVGQGFLLGRPAPASHLRRFAGVNLVTDVR